MMQRREWLILVPTKLELKIIQPLLVADGSTIEICGFGPIVPAAKTLQLIEKHQPAKVLLLGIAGAYGETLAVGQAAVFSAVGCYGVGVGSGRSFQTAGQMGWRHWPGDTSEDAIDDVVSLKTADELRGQETTNRQPFMLLTAMSASENESDVQQRLDLFPDAIAEDMEGFAVAAACQLMTVPLSIVRGISNRAGDRAHQNWQVEAALIAATKLSRKIMRAES